MWHSMCTTFLLVHNFMTLHWPKEKMWLPLTCSRHCFSWCPRQRSSSHFATVFASYRSSPFVHVSSVSAEGSPHVGKACFLNNLPWLLREIYNNSEKHWSLIIKTLKKKLFQRCPPNTGEYIYIFSLQYFIKVPWGKKCETKKSETQQW